MYSRSLVMAACAIACLPMQSAELARNLSVKETEQLPGLIRATRISLSRSNGGREAGGSKKRRAKLFARAHGRRMKRGR